MFNPSHVRLILQTGYFFKMPFTALKRRRKGGWAALAAVLNEHFEQHENYLRQSEPPLVAFLSRLAALGDSFNQWYKWSRDLWEMWDRGNITAKSLRIFFEGPSLDDLDPETLPKIKLEPSFCNCPKPQYVVIATHQKIDLDESHTKVDILYCEYCKKFSMFPLDNFKIIKEYLTDGKILEICDRVYQRHLKDYW